MFRNFERSYVFRTKTQSKKEWLNLQKKSNDTKHLARTHAKPYSLLAFFRLIDPFVIAKSFFLQNLVCEKRSS